MLESWPALPGLQGHLSSERTTLLTRGQLYITSRVSRLEINRLYDLLATTLIDKLKADMALCGIRDEIANNKNNQPGLSMSTTQLLRIYLLPRGYIIIP